MANGHLVDHTTLKVCPTDHFVGIMLCIIMLIQRTICLVGNASELTSQIRREKILTAIDPSWSKFGSEEFSTSKSKNTLFGEENLTSMVEKDTALAKAVSVTKRHKKDKNIPPTKKTGPQTFRKAPPPGK